ncbi:MAG: multiheme c-type cytochrome [Acidobacteriota bacterium]
MFARKYRYLHWSVLFSLSAMLACSAPPEDDKLPAPLTLTPGQLTEAARCGECHVDIYSVWMNSVHARAASVPAFLEAFDDAVKREGDSARSLCLRCHAPASVVTGDLVLSSPLNQEGVSCDFCHSLVGWNRDDRQNPFLLEVGGAMHGPVEDAQSLGHPVAFSEFHTQSEHCGACHEYVSPYGVPVLSTYSEWLEYYRNQGKKTCQECHMPLVVASVVDPKVARVRGGFVNLHSMPGGHSKDQLIRALRLRIQEIVREKDTVKVRVSLRNQGAGHQVPTGSPSRKIVLQVSATTPSGATAQQEQVFQRIVVDQAGQPILEDSRIFFETAAVQSDNRLGPGEERVVEAVLKVPPDENVKVRAALTYLYSPQNRPETETRFEFYSESRDLVATWSR